MTSLSICVCLRWRIYLQSAMWFIGRITSRPKTRCTGLLTLVVWYVKRTAKAATARIPIHGSALSTYVSCRLYVRTEFPSTFCILSMIPSALEFPGDTGLVLIPQLFYIKLFLNLWPRNSTPRSYLISTGHVYRTSHIFSTNFAIVTNFLLWYCVTSIHLVNGSTTVNAFKIKSSLPFLHIL